MRCESGFRRPIFVLKIHSDILKKLSRSCKLQVVNMIKMGWPVSSRCDGLYSDSSGKLMMDLCAFFIFKHAVVITDNERFINQSYPKLAWPEKIRQVKA